MRKTKTMRILGRLSVAAMLLVLRSMPALANGDDSPCSVEAIAGNWIFGTEVGQQSLIPGQEGDITALGTMNIDSAGNVSGEFAVTIKDFIANPVNTYNGSITVDPDCTGTLNFVTSTGSTRTDHIGILNESEMWGMSLDPANLWTYKVRRISKPGGPDAIAAELAFMKGLVRRLAAAHGVLRRGE